MKSMKKIYLAGTLGTMAIIAAFSVGIVNARESILAESVSVHNTEVGTENSKTISTGQISTGEETKGDSNVSYTTNENTESSAIVETWVPKTAEEKKYYSFVGTEKLAVTTSGATGIKAANSVQGPSCQKVFESVLGDYTIGRTYNIFPGAGNLNNPVYELEEEIQITMEIPKALQKEGRSFELICVSDGIPYVFKDTDKDGSSISINTKYFYAYALCYKD